MHYVYKLVDELSGMWETLHDSEDFYPFPSRAHALLYMLLNSPRPMVHYLLPPWTHATSNFCRARVTSNLFGSHSSSYALLAYLVSARLKNLPLF